MEFLKQKLNLAIFFICTLFFAGSVLADQSTMSVFVVQISAPEGLSAVAESFEQINLSWSPVSGAASYNVYKSGTLIASVSDTSYSCAGLDPQTSYSFQVTAVDSDSNESLKSSAVEAVTLSRVSQTGGGGNTYGYLIVPAQKKDLAVPEGGFRVLINNGKEKTNDRSAILELSGGPDAVKAEISNSPDFENSVIESYVTKKTWVLSPGDGEKTVYVRFLGEDGSLSPVAQDNILLDSAPPKIVFLEKKESYSESEEIIIKGVVSETAGIVLTFDGKYGSLKTDAGGNFFMDLGKAVPGSHLLILTFEDVAENFKTIAIDILIESSPYLGPAENQVSETKPSVSFIFKNLREKIASMNRYGSIEKSAGATKIIFVSEKAPEVLFGKWKLLKIPIF